jgi:hypothetical protein
MILVSVIIVMILVCVTIVHDFCKFVIHVEKMSREKENNRNETKRKKERT